MRGMSGTDTKITATGAYNAAKAGGQAFRDGKSLSDCPRIGDDEAADQFYSHHWLKGYTLASGADADAGDQPGDVG